MQLLRKHNFYRILLLAGLLLAGRFASANDGGGIVAKAVLDGSLKQLKADSARTVEDSAFFNHGGASYFDTAYRVQNLITLKINEATNLHLRTDFSVTVQLRIIYSNGTALDSITRPFTINYDSANAYNSKSSFVFYGGRRVTVKVISVVSNVSSWDVSSVLMVENQLTAKPKFIFNCAATVSNITVITPTVPNPDELTVTWTTVRGADQYDLEWAYIDSSAIDSGRYGSPTAPDPAQIFFHNATRVTTTGNSYNIPLMYDNGGALYIRVRTTQSVPGNAVITAIWSTEASSPVMGKWGFRGHERALNWQSTMTFAEEGKRKVVVQYFDGSLRNRQTVTKDNTTQTTIVAETYYDYQGRPAIQVMPAPSLSNIIKYTGNFNVGVNGAEYTQGFFDTLTSPELYCAIRADSMSNSSGAAQYYSPNNPLKTQGLNQFIPDAHNYPFTETEYTSDNTGRISRQGGTGKDHQLGTGHETKYYYGTPDQNELDALFGTEVGDRSHYFKNMVRDANGQYSVSYVDMHGRTIATALAGHAPASLAALPSNVGTTITETLADSNSTFLQDLSLINQKSILVPVGGIYSFNYNLNPGAFTEKDCEQQNICYTCRYDLQITITDNCNNQLLPGGKAFDTLVRNFSFGNIPTDCNGAPTPMNVTFDLDLKEGSYMVTKKLTVSKDAYVFYRDSVYLPGNTCVSLEQYITQQRAIVALTSPQCATTCHACRDSLGTLIDFRNEFMVKTGLTAADTASYRGEILEAYTKAARACESLCGDSLSVSSDIRATMLQDMTPPYGQYADPTDNKVDKYSIFFARPGTDEISYPPVFQFNNISYTDGSGKTDSVYNLESDIMVLPNALTKEQFIQNFRTTWAEALLPFHPEYCKLMVLEANKPSLQWDRRMESVDNFRDARRLGYLNPLGRSDHHFPVVTSDLDPLPAGASNWYNYIKGRMEAYLPAAGGNPTLSMWAMACLMTKCKASDIDCINHYAQPQNYFDTTAMCEGDLDMAWRNFRQLYLNVKQDIINNISSFPQNCTPNNPAYGSVPSSAQLFADQHQPAFTEDTRNTIKDNSLEYLLNGAGNTGAANQAAANAQAELNRFYDDNSKAFASRWIEQLSPCLYNAAHLQDSILPRLTALCRLACDSDHPFGASTLKPGQVYTPAGTNYLFKSFQDIIRTYNALHNITDTLRCNAELITSPQPYDKQPVYSNKPVFTKPSDCECQLINDLYNTFLVTNRGDVNFAAWLKRTQQITMNNDDLNTLRKMCNTDAATSCIYLPKPILLPSSMQCNTGEVCATCTIVDSMYQDYTALYPDKVPQLADESDTVQTSKNTLFQNFMNNRLGFNLSAWQYIQFRDTCAAHVGIIYDSTHCIDKPIGDLYLSDLPGKLNDIQFAVTNGYILAGTSRSPLNSSIDASLIRTDLAGNVLWTKTYGGAADDLFVRVKPTADSGFIAIGTTYSGHYPKGAMLVVKLNANGDTRWTKTIGFNTFSGERGYDVIQTNDGGYAALGIYNEHAGTGEFLLSRLDTAGVINWTHKFGTSRIQYNDCGPNEADSIAYEGDPAFGLIEDIDTLLVAGAAYDINMGNRYYGVIYRIQKDSGNLINSWHYADNTNLNTSTRFSGIQSTTDGYLVSAITANGLGSGNSKVAVIGLTVEGNVTSYKQFNRPVGSSRVTSSDVLPMTEGGYLVAQTVNSGSHIFYQRVGADGSLLWASETSLPGSQQIGRLIRNTDNTFSVAGVNNNQAMLLKVQPESPTSCYDNAVNLGITSPQLNRIGWALSGDQLLFPLHTDTSFLASTLTLRDSSLVCVGNGNCYTVYEGPRLCGKSAPIFPSIAIDSITSCSDSTFFAVSKATELYKNYVDSLTGAFEQQYNAKCLEAYRYETFTVTHAKREYHYTLYYYDQADNLVKTVPPAGVVENNDPNWLLQVKAARMAHQVLVPAHSLASNYRYNSIDVIVEQYTPDAGLGKYWYDRLGRLSVSQNAKQAFKNQYSYNKYDSIGRIVQVGQIVSSTVITDAISRKHEALRLWLENAALTADQIIQTTYDYAYEPLNPILRAKNVRNRTGWTALYNTASDLDTNGIAAATYYSYDVLGNVDTVVQDYKDGVMGGNGNRFKKLVYDYDLVSGKANRFSYQAGQPDAFYHKYIYDAENRITSIQTSTDSIHWENDAFYMYYAHGPLARTILGEQQVQGINKAYSIRGWLKEINPKIHTASGYNLIADGSTGSIVANPGYHLLINYYQGDYTPISEASTTDSGIPTSLADDFKPLFNGNIYSMGIDIPVLSNPLLYNYQYDQLNRIVGMDVWKRNSTKWNTITKISDFQERISYDANGNILRYKRQGNHSFAGTPLGMDSLNYHYMVGSNRLDHVADSVPASNYSIDLDHQPVGNYRYDNIGNLVFDSSENINKIEWTLQGKIRSIVKKDGAIISYTYDVAGNRISKKFTSGGLNITTWYVRDTEGNTISTYTSGDSNVNNGDLTQREQHLIGETRFGMVESNTNVENLVPAWDTTMSFLGTGYGITFTRGKRLFELNNHLGNVLITISDKKIGNSLNDSTVDYFDPQIINAQDYYPFGMLQPGRSYTRSGSTKYRYGLNGKENDNEVKGEGNQIDFGFRVYDPRLGKFLSVDPLYQKYPQYSPYHFSSNQPIHTRELEGLESEFDLSIPHSPDDVDASHWKSNTQHKAPNSMQWVDVHGNKLTFDKAQFDANGNALPGFKGKDHWHFETSAGERLNAEGKVAKSYGAKEAHLNPGSKTSIKIKPSITTVVADGISKTKTTTTPVVEKKIDKLNGKIGNAMVILNLSSSILGIKSGNPDALINWFGTGQVGELKMGHLGTGFGNYYMITREETKEWTENNVKYKTVTRFGQNYMGKAIKDGKYVGAEPVGQEWHQTETYQNGNRISTSSMDENREMVKL